MKDIYVKESQATLCSQERRRELETVLNLTASKPDSQQTWQPTNLTANKPGSQQTWQPTNLTASKPDSQQTWQPANLTASKPDSQQTWQPANMTASKPESWRHLTATYQPKLALWLLQCQHLLHFPLCVSYYVSATAAVVAVL